MPSAIKFRSSSKKKQHLILKETDGQGIVQTIRGRSRKETKKVLDKPERL